MKTSNSKPNVVGIIPARMGSNRFPGKPLSKICGIPMVGHVYLRSRMSKAMSDVYIATCDKEISDYASSIGAQAVMTASTHERASDRAAEAMLKIERQTGNRVDIAVMIQGDEPMLQPGMIDESLGPLYADDTIQLTNLMSPIHDLREFDDPNVVKVVTDDNCFALYFSREPIPSRKKAKTNVPMYKQVAIIPFRRDFLIKFNELKPTPLEIAESVDMLRVLEHGHKVKMVRTCHATYGVDTPADLERVEFIMSEDKLRSVYAAEKEL